MGNLDMEQPKPVSIEEWLSGERDWDYYEEDDDPKYWEHLYGDYPDDYDDD